jgi:drug/metabolite transporter (DMT)-like permease
MSTTAAATVLAMLAFAANSLLARAALGAGAADPAGYTVVRLVSGAIFLWLFLTWRNVGKSSGKLDGSWVSAAALFGYAIAFSIAYVRLGAATGALILFATVQLSMILWGLYKGERPRPLQILNLNSSTDDVAVLRRHIPCLRRAPCRLPWLDRLRQLYH